MGSGRSGLYSGTRGGGPVPGSADYMQAGDAFSRNIRNRKDVDANGFYDVIAHGTSGTIQIQHNGQPLDIDHRTAAKLFKNDPAFKGKSIRLLACDTGADPRGFAQSLANKLNVVVEAPTKLVWAWPDGTYKVAARRRDQPDLPDLKNKGRFVKYYPGGKKK